MRFFLGKRQVARPGAIGGRKPREPRQAVPDDLALEFFRNLFGSE
jgi:hypothetical protein